MSSIHEHIDGPIAILALLKGDDAYAPPSSKSTIPLLVVEPKYEPAFAPFRGWLGAMIAWVAVELLFKPSLIARGRRVNEFVKSAGVTSILAVMDSPSSMLLAAELSRKLKLPLITLVWDLPSHTLKQLGHSGASLRSLESEFAKAMRRSRNVLVMSENMKQQIEQNYGVPATVIHQPVSPEWSPRVPVREEQGDFAIGFAGSVTAKSEISCLLRALDSVDWEVGGKPVRLVVTGLRFVCHARGPQLIEYRGYLHDVGDVVDVLAGCNILFLPQPFDQGLESFSRYSFPTKLTTYMAAKRPILLLAPPYATLTKFFTEHDLPLVCEKLEPNLVLDALTRLACDQELVSAAIARTSEVRRSEFDPATFGRRLKKVLSGPSVRGEQ